jgi:hypothetical protein
MTIGRVWIGHMRVYLDFYGRIVLLLVKAEQGAAGEELQHSWGEFALLWCVVGNKRWVCWCIELAEPGVYPLPAGLRA